ncbi:hypothetical protein D3C72_618310 [compost metagenome]|jgi:hypothetical protein
MFVSSDNQDQTALIEATRAYVRTVSAVADPRVTVEKVAGEHARVRVEAPDGQASAAFVYLKKAQGKWKALDLGTGFDAAYYDKQGIPAALRL